MKHQYILVVAAFRISVKTHLSHLLFKSLFPCWHHVEIWTWYTVPCLQKLKSRELAQCFATWRDAVSTRRVKHQKLVIAKRHHALKCLREALIGWEVVISHEVACKAAMTKATFYWQNGLAAAAFNCWHQTIKQKLSHRLLLQGNFILAPIWPFHVRTQS